MIEKLPELDSLALLAGVTAGAVQLQHDKINELIEEINQMNEKIHSLQPKVLSEE